MPRPGFVSYAIVMRLLTMSIVWLSLLIWFLNAYRAGCVTALAVLALLGLVLLAAGMEKSLLRRRALFQECMAEQVHDEYRYALARQWGMWFSVALLWGEAIMVLTLSPPENYLGQRWQEVVTYGVSQSDVLCPQVADLTNVLAAAQALAMWAVQNASLVLNDPTQAVMVWVGFVSLFGLTFLVAWAFSQALIGVMARPWEVWSLSAMPAPMRNPALPAGRKSDAKQDHA